MSDETTLDTLAARPVALLIDVYMGAGPDTVAEAWTNRDSPIDAGDEYANTRYWPFPGNAAEIRLPRFDGGLEDPPLSWIVPRVGVFAQYGFGTAAYPVTIHVDECDPTDVAATRRPLYLAKVKSVLVNPRGLTRCVEIRLAGIKAELDVPAGIRCVPTCQWIFGGKGCCVDLSDKQFTGTVTAISTTSGEESLVTVSFDEYANEYAGSPEHDPRMWRNGWIERNGCRVRIRAKDEYSYQFTLSQVPPSNWLNATVLAQYGCDQQVSTCRDVWDNLSKIIPLGIAMQDQDRQTAERP